MEIKEVVLIKGWNHEEFLRRVKYKVDLEQKNRRKVEIQYAPIVVGDRLYYTAFITSGVTGE